MRTNSAVQLPATVAVETENPVTGRKPILSKPVMEFAAGSDSLSLGGTTSVDVIDSEKGDGGFSTTGAMPPTIGVEDGQSCLGCLSFPNAPENLRLQYPVLPVAFDAIGLSSVRGLRPLPKRLERLIGGTPRAVLHACRSHLGVLGSKGRGLPRPIANRALALLSIQRQAGAATRRMAILRPRGWAEIVDRLHLMTPETFFTHTWSIQRIS